MTTEGRKAVARKREWIAEGHRGTTWLSLAAQHPEMMAAPAGIDSPCPRCGAAGGEMCVTTSGLLLSGWASHGARA